MPQTTQGARTPILLNHYGVQILIVHKSRDAKDLVVRIQEEANNHWNGIWKNFPTQVLQEDVGTS